MQRNEAEEQAIVVKIIEGCNCPIFHIPNGAYGAKNLSRQGVRAGVPDLMIPVARGAYHGLFIEMKIKKGTVSEKQRRWIDLLNKQKYLAIVAYGAEEAIQIFQKYIKLRCGEEWVE